MRYGARDGWVCRLVYTSEPHEGALLFTFHLALGKLAAWLSGGGARVEAGPLIVAYHAARVACGAFMLGVIYRFVAAFVRARALRRLAWTIAAVGGGLGWLPLLALGGRARLPVEFYVPEAFSFLIVYGLPHLALARGLLLLGWLALIRATEASEARRAWLAGLAWFGMGVIVPFYAAVTGVQIGAWLLICALSERRIEWRRVGLAAQAGVLPLVVLIYNAWVFTTNPVLKAWAAQNRLPSPPPLDYILAFGVLIGLAALQAACQLAACGAFDGLSAGQRTAPPAGGDDRSAGDTGGGGIGLAGAGKARACGGDGSIAGAHSPLDGHADRRGSVDCCNGGLAGLSSCR
jgi:hypothetical protein